MIPGDAKANTVAVQVAETRSSLDSTTICPVHSEMGECKHGFKCRFLGAHAKTAENGSSDQLSLVVDGEKVAHAAVSAVELNFVDPNVRKQLRTRKVTGFNSPRGWDSADRLRSGIARLPSYTCKVSEADIGRLPERDSTVVGREGSENPRTLGGGAGRSNREIRCRL